MTASATPPAIEVTDVIDQIVGIQPGDALDAIRARRSAARLHAQESHVALFGNVADDASFTPAERFAVATFVTALHADPELTGFYAAGLAARGASAALREAVAAEAASAAGVADAGGPATGAVHGLLGPYGRFPTGPLSTEDAPGPVHAVSDAHRAVLGTRLAAAIAHAHLLVLHPRDAQAVALQALLDAGWSTTDIVTLSQLVAFLSFQIRVIAGLRTLAALPDIAYRPASFAAA